VLMASNIGKAYDEALESALLRVVSATLFMVTPLVCRATPFATPLPRAADCQIYS
jgi:hypothetical protein